MKQNSTTTIVRYTCRGRVCGCCGVRHRSLHAAVAHQARENAKRAARPGGGWVDWDTVRADGAELTEEECAEWRAIRDEQKILSLMAEEDTMRHFEPTKPSETYYRGPVYTDDTESHPDDLAVCASEASVLEIAAMTGQALLDALERLPWEDVDEVCESCKIREVDFDLRTMDIDQDHLVLHAREVR